MDDRTSYKYNTTELRAVNYNRVATLKGALSPLEPGPPASHPLHVHMLPPADRRPHRRLPAPLVLSSIAGFALRCRAPNKCNTFVKCRYYHTSVSR